ncbi:hypothetical protein BDZ94DRAFT_1273391 [Collybia nuda]|uniref:Uncharacterized protein n=1 Tax=Collybia nuda TaxID=64659 RepID=A0A9P6C9I5_9AGAR|nr:hypothetical protein BDZ94DRAFT_1273391 [Collybia nuda]
MAPRNANDVSSDEDDAPESYSLTQSRQHIKTRDDELKKIQTAERDKKRARNRERDRRLKEQAENSKRKRNEAQNGDSELIARMERAMQEAQMEMDDDDEEEGEDDDGEHGDDEKDESDDEDEDADEDEEDEGDDGEEFKGIRESSDDEDEDMGSSDAESSQSMGKPKAHPDHLPDHLFSSAFNSQTSKSASKRKAKEDVHNIRSRKRARSTATPKDVIIGGRAIRTLKQGGPPSAVGMIPSTKAKKFLDRNLGMKGDRTKTRGWERRPANIGVMRRNGPAANFVRNR